MNPAGQTDRAGQWIRTAARTAAAMVALVAGAASFEHIASVAIAAGERTWVGYSLPVAIDGLIVVGVTALIEDQRQHRRPRGVARLAVTVGVTATLAANIASADPTWTARLVALAAPVSFLLSVEVLTRSGRRLSTPAATTVEQASKPATADDGRKSARAVDSRRQNTPTRRRPNTAQRVADAVARNPTATPAQIAARLKVSERTVHRYWPDPPSGDGDNGRRAVPRPGLAPVPTTAFTSTNRRAAVDRTETVQ